MEVLNPATGEAIAEVPAGTAADVDAAVEAAKAALPEWLDSTPAERAEVLLKLADVIDDERRRARRDRVAERRQAARVREGRDAGVLGQPALLRRCGADPRGPVGRRVHEGLHVDDPPRAARDRRRDRAVELPADDGGLEARARARRGQRPGAEAVRADAALAAPLRRAGAGRDPGRRAERRHRRRRPGRRADRHASRRPPRLADGRRRDRQDDRPHGGRHPQARPPRARRQGAGDRLRRRRPGRGRRGDQDRRLLELRARTAPPPRA